LTNTCSHAILFSIVIEAKNAVQISQELQLSLSTVYKTLANLEKLTLVTIEDFEFSNEGKKIKRYRSRIKKASIEIDVNDYEVNLYSVKTN
jgi:predicted transcriptional regulator